MSDVQSALHSVTVALQAVADEQDREEAAVKIQQPYEEAAATKTMEEVACHKVHSKEQQPMHGPPTSAAKCPASDNALPTPTTPPDPQIPSSSRRILCNAPISNSKGLATQPSSAASHSACSFVSCSSMPAHRSSSMWTSTLVAHQVQCIYGNLLFVSQEDGKCQTKAGRPQDGSLRQPDATESKLADLEKQPYQTQQVCLAASPILDDIADNKKGPSSHCAVTWQDELTTFLVEAQMCIDALKACYHA